jgi:Spy/CpxP family protein refolding chaperone
MDDIPNYGRGNMSNQHPIHRCTLTPEQQQKIIDDFKAKMKESAKHWPRRGRKKQKP